MTTITLTGDALRSVREEANKAAAHEAKFYNMRLNAHEVIDVEEEGPNITVSFV